MILWSASRKGMRVPLLGLLALSVWLLTGTPANGQAPTIPAASTAPAKKTIQTAQERLLALGYQPGSADGVMGARAIAALKKFQTDHILPVTGQLDRKTLDALSATTPASNPRVTEPPSSSVSRDLDAIRNGEPLTLAEGDTSTVEPLIRAIKQFTYEELHRSAKSTKVGPKGRPAQTNFTCPTSLVGTWMDRDGREVIQISEQNVTGGIGWVIGSEEQWILFSVPCTASVVLGEHTISLHEGWVVAFGRVTASNPPVFITNDKDFSTERPGDLVVRTDEFSAGPLNFVSQRYELGSVRKDPQSNP